MVAVSWWLLLSAGETRIKWLYLLYLIWFVLGLLTCKIALIRFSYPLPAERTAEHYRYQDAERRTWIRVVNVLSWFLVFVLLSIALRHTRSLARMEPGLQWFVRGAALALGGSCIFMAFRGIRQLTEMGRDLRPVGSWATPFRASSMWITVSRAYQIWFAVWFGVLLVMILFLCFR
jgi:amino acid transporter